MAPVTQGPLTGQAARTSVVEFASDRPCYHPQAGRETLIVVCLACQLAHQLTATAAREITAPSDAIHAIETVASQGRIGGRISPIAAAATSSTILPIASFSRSPRAHGVAISPPGPAQNGGTRPSSGANPTRQGNGASVRAGNFGIWPQSVRLVASYGNSGTN